VQFTRKRIIAAAMDLIEHSGIEAVSMDRLATHLGCGLVALYSYVPSTSALLDSVGDALLSGIELPPAGTGGWQELTRAQAIAFRAIARAWPRCTVVVISRRQASATTLRPVEHALGALRDAGFAPHDAVRIVRVLVAYVIGSVLGEIEVAPGLAADDVLADRRPRLRSADFPHLTAVAADHDASTADADFEFGLDLLIHSVAALQPVRAVAS
jgi:AcrR family transcriptional regulator